MLKNILIVGGAIFLLASCGRSHAQTPAPTQAEVSACYDRVSAAAGPAWADMSVIERAFVAGRAISACEGGQP